MVFPVRISYKPQFTQDIFETVAIATKKPPTYPIKGEQEELIRGNSMSRNYLDSFECGIIYNRVGFQRIFTAPSKQHAQSFTNFLPEQVKLDGQWGVATSEISHPSMYQNVTEGKFTFYDEKLSRTTEDYYFEPGLYSSTTSIVEALNTLIQETNNDRQTCITIKINRVTQKLKV